jgi:3-oxoadipate enol-lactonase
MDRVAVGSATLATARHGDGPGPWITLVHGGLVGAWGWQAQTPTRTKANLLAAGPLLVFDQRGYGDSSPGGPHDVATLAGDLVALWEACGIEETIVVGFSAGGAVALDAAVRAPERVAGLVLEGWAEPDEATRRGFLSRADDLEGDAGVVAVHAHVQAAFSPAFAAAQPELVEEYTTVAERTARATVAQTFRSLAGWRLTPAHAALPVPVLLVAGEHDRAFGPAAGRALAARLPDAEPVTLLRAGHTAHLEQAAGFNHLVVDFADRVTAGRGRPRRRA